MVDVIVVAAGSGSRLGASVPKAFVPLNGKEIFYYSAKCFDAHPEVNNVILVVPEPLLSKTKELVKDYDLTKVTKVVAGGEERNDSVANGFEQLNANADIVLIHDAARALLSSEVVDRVLKAMENSKAVFPAVPAVDTIKEVSLDSMKVIKTLDRSKLYCVQTPQAFTVDMIPVLLKKAKNTDVAYDEAMLLEGECPIQVVEGDYRNFKITVKSDLKYAEFLMGEKYG